MRNNGHTFACMPNASSRSQNKTRQFYGEAVSEKLIPWLNDDEPDAGHKRVRKLLELYWRIAEGKEPDFQRAMRELKAICQRYSYFPLLAPVPFDMAGPQAQWFPARKTKTYSHGWPIEYDEMNAVFDLATLSGAGVLKQLALCRCGKFFFQKFIHQKFCSTKCRLEEFRSSPEVRAKRNAYARRLYKLHKSGKVK
jgi:hypothetical protein